MNFKENEDSDWDFCDVVPIQEPPLNSLGLLNSTELPSRQTQTRISIASQTHTREPGLPYTQSLQPCDTCEGYHYLHKQCLYTMPFTDYPTYYSLYLFSLSHNIDTSEDASLSLKSVSTEQIKSQIQPQQILSDVALWQRAFDLDTFHNDKCSAEAGDSTAEKFKTMLLTESCRQVLVDAGKLREKKDARGFGDTGDSGLARNSYHKCRLRDLSEAEEDGVEAMRSELEKTGFGTMASDVLRMKAINRRNELANE
ncbi:hypothetical protein CAC42_2962 [Sphaceloma murrayae]|uniref:Uncharacterized protein n=1 Tax=Sphaceloma murrayae TaxID=2082308 RepID=A0A2K1R0A1_9PEZI|nr:hypothetical protein CAC42_2962 [Sphaceloma murrayae]